VFAIVDETVHTIRQENPSAFSCLKVCIRMNAEHYIDSVLVEENTHIMPRQVPFSSYGIDVDIAVISSFRRRMEEYLSNLPLFMTSQRLSL
jgi:hypothetical protein